MKRSFIAAATALLIGATLGADDLSMDETALDTVGTAYSVSDKVLLLGYVGEGVSIHTKAVHTASVPGARAEMSLKDQSGHSGYLRYTVHGHGLCKITVETQTAGYISGALNVGSYSKWSSGSDVSTIGTPVASWPSSTPIYRDNPQDFIVDISGSDTWTGTAAGSGASITYGLFYTPGVDSVEVLYTIVEQNAQ